MQLPSDVRVGPRDNNTNYPNTCSGNNMIPNAGFTLQDLELYVSNSIMYNSMALRNCFYTPGTMKELFD